MLQISSEFIIPDKFFEVWISIFLSISHQVWKINENKGAFTYDIRFLGQAASDFKVHIFWEGHKSKGKISQNFVAFSEYMNFTK